MHVSYVRLYRDQEGVVVHSEEADEEIKKLNLIIQTQQQKIFDLQDMLDMVRKIAFDLNEEILKGKN